MIRMKSEKSTMVFLVVFLLGLLAAREAFSSPPNLKTATARELLAAVAEKNLRLKVSSLYTFQSGERFAEVESKEGKLWLQLLDHQTPRVGDTLQLDTPTYLFREPVVEEMEGDVDQEANQEQNQEAWLLDSKSRHPFNPGKLGANTACTRFIGTDGRFGSWGAYLMTKLNPNEHPHLFAENQGDLGTVCPRFASMNIQEKKNFWVWLATSMANYESSCNERVKAKGVNGTAAGLLQLHLGKEYNYGCRRGINSLSARDNLECGMTILNRDVRRTGKIFPSKDNYWHVLRPQSGPGARTLRMARQYRPCF